MSGAPGGVPPRIRVLCVDDNEDIVGAFNRAARREPDLEPLEGISDYAQLAGALDRLRPDVVLFDLSVARTDPFGAIREISGRPDAPRVVVFSGHDDPEIRAEASRAGASGFAPKFLDMAGVFAVIRSVAGPKG